MSLIIWYVCVSVPLCLVLRHLVKDEKEWKGILKNRRKDNELEMRRAYATELMRDGMNVRKAIRRANVVTIQSIRDYWKKSVTSVDEICGESASGGESRESASGGESRESRRSEESFGSTSLVIPEGFVVETVEMLDGRHEITYIETGKESFK